MADTSEIAVLVVSCDKYSDLWRPFFTLFFRYWHSCPYPVYLLTNHQLYPDNRVTVLNIGEDVDWSSSLIKVLAELPQPYVLVLLEDYLFTDHTDTSRIQALAACMKQKNAACLRLYPCPGPNVPLPDDSEVGEISKRALYLVSTQAALWNKRVLAGLLKSGESAWRFEIEGSRRAAEIALPFLSVKRTSPYPMPYFCTGVVKGKWLRDAVNLCAKEGIRVDLAIRPLENPIDRFMRTWIYSAIVKSLVVAYHGLEVIFTQRFWVR